MRNGASYRLPNTSMQTSSNGKKSSTGSCSDAAVNLTYRGIQKARTSFVDAQPLRKSMVSITLIGSPRSTGNIYKTMCRGNFPRTYMTNEGKSLKESYQWQSKSQFKFPPILGDIEVSVHLYFGTKRRCDIDNFNKILFDSLTGIVWTDDSQIIRSVTEKHYDKYNPRIEIEILRP